MEGGKDVIMSEKGTILALVFFQYTQYPDYVRVCVCVCVCMCAWLASLIVGIGELFSQIFYIRFEKVYVCVCGG